MAHVIFTVGHSVHSEETFVSLLREHEVTAICDVRSKPFSRNNPQFNREQIKASLQRSGIAYVFLGKELGARSQDAECYEDGRVQYERLAATALFKAGIDRLLLGVKTHRIALMCAEKEPLDCHRTILVARSLVERGLAVDHIHANGGLESQNQALSRLMRQLRLDKPNMFTPYADLEAEAYRMQELKIAYSLPEPAGARHLSWSGPVTV